jgi:hypothetical protein
MLSNKVSIKFEIDCFAKGPKGGKVAWTNDCVEGISNYIPLNGRRNCQGNFISYELGEIILDNLSVMKRKNGLIIELDITCENIISDNIENITEIIWVIMPSCYSEEVSDIFNFDNKANDNSKMYCTLVIQDVPKNISYQLL